MRDCSDNHAGDKEEFLVFVFYPTAPPPRSSFPSLCDFSFFFAFGKPLHERDTFRTISERGCMEPVRDKFLAFRLIFSL